MSAIRAPMEKKIQKVHGILKIMEPCANLLGRSRRALLKMQLKNVKEIVAWTPGLIHSLFFNYTINYLENSFENAEIFEFEVVPRSLIPRITNFFKIAWGLIHQRSFRSWLVLFLNTNISVGQSLLRQWPHSKPFLNVLRGLKSSVGVWDPAGSDSSCISI